MNHPERQTRSPPSLSRRELFQRVSGGIYGAALAHLLEQAAGPQRLSAAAEVAGAPVVDLRPRRPQFEPKATSVIHLFMNGGPSQMDLFDPKPVLDQHHGETYFDKIAGEVENPESAGALMRCPYKFAQHGQCGMWVSDALPHLAKHVDDIALIRSMHTTNLTHEPAVYIIQSGKMGPGRPTLGAWVVYGLGSECENLPAYVVLDDPLGLPVNGVENWQAGFLPPIFQGTRFRSTGSPVLNLRPDVDRPEEVVRAERELLSQLDERHRRARPGQPTLDARIASYELAARMQLAASDALDISRESQATQDRYGIGREPTDSYGRRCLIARRLVERGVRFVQLYINGQIWDNHTGLADGLKAACARTDQPIAALLGDLRQRGLLDSTLVVWGGEFGRLPIAQLPADKDATKAGRDHNKNAFCTWMAGAGIKGGTTYGATDELGLAAVEDRVSVPDWHATILHLLGLAHDELFVLDNGLKEKLTGVLEARVVREILA
ncbi:MAG TPA: DUF1501 domain-containing protein [Pirellulales bacterium]|nr:DUF1501 domain-containing protein [Pirellulales bacterium]